jgi:thiol-disulfide isomerase/thioredoxin
MAIVLPLVLLTSACGADPLAEQYREGSGKGYIAGDGTVAEWAPAERGAPVVFDGELENGDIIRSADLVGDVVVVNFWYAACAPCRAEAPDLEALHQQFSDADVTFLGVNVRDQADTALAFAETYGVTYPSIIDLDKRTGLAFAGLFAPNAVPTTLVLDESGRVAARIVGRVSEPSILETLIEDTASEEPE